MECAELLDALKKGERLDGPEAAAHLAGCAGCSALQGGTWAFQLRRAGKEEEVDMQALKASLDARLAREDGFLGWLKSRPTWVRHLLLAVFVLPCPIVMALAAGASCPRNDLHSYPMGRFAAELSCLALVAIAGVIGALRPLHRPAPRNRAAAIVAGMALLLALGLTLLPRAHDHPQPDLPASHCLVNGLVFGLPLVVSTLLLSRWVTWPVIALAGAAAGMFGDLALHLLCPVPDPVHLLLGHASVVALYVGMAGLAWLVRGRGARGE